MVTFYLLLCVVICLWVPTRPLERIKLERIKRDKTSFADNVGGPLARGWKINSTNISLQSGQANVNFDLQPCERNEIAKFPTPIRNGVYPGFPRQRPDQTFADIKAEFEAFKRKFQKRYLGKMNETEILQIFAQNRAKIGQLIGKRISPFDAIFDVTKFADQPFELFKILFTGAIAPGANESRRLGVVQLNEPRCKSLQWTSKNILPPVRDQKECGACYAMATSDLLLAQKKIEAKSWNQAPQSLSAQYLSDCFVEPGAYQCNGGRPINLLKDLVNCTRNNVSKCGLPLENCYPYKAQNQTCQSNQTKCTYESLSLSSAEMLDIRGLNEKSIMAHLLNWGPVIAIVGVSEALQFYNGSGIIRPYQCNEDQVHAVLITGYDYSTCVPTYTVRNSWGSDWGVNGYAKFEAGKNTCAVAKSVISSCVAKCGKSAGVVDLDYISKHANFPPCS